MSSAVGTECYERVEDWESLDRKVLVEIILAQRRITELPQVHATVTEYRLHALECASCGTVTRGELPVGVPDSAFGP